MNWAGVLSYGTAATAFLILAAVLGVGWRGREVGARLILAALVTAGWAGALAAQYWRGDPPGLRLSVVEWLRFSAWVFAVAGLANAAGALRGLVWGAYAFCAVGVALALLDAGGWWAQLGIWQAGGGLAAGIGMPIVGLVLLEQLYRNSHATGRRALQPLFIGLGGMFVFDLFMYSQAAMTVAISPEALAARGFVNAVCVPAIAVAARRNPDWSLDVFVSRQAVFYSTTFLAVGIYLLAMAAGGYLIAAVGGQWGAVAQVVFLAGAGVVLVTLVASDFARNRLRVFLNKHFYRNKYDYRIEWLRFVNALDTGGADAESRAPLIRAVAQIVGSHFGTLWIRVDEERRLVLATHWSDSGPRDGAFAAIDVASEFVEFLEQRQWIVDLAELRRSPEVYQNLRLPESLAARHDLKLFVPLMHGRRLVGLMGLGSPDAPFEINFEDRDLLKTIGRHVGTHIAQLEADRRLTESRQFEAYSRLTAYVMHDLKNLVAQLSLVVSNAEKHRRNPAFVDDTIDTIRNSTDRMTRLIEQLQRGELRSRDRPVALRGLLERVVERTGGRQPIPTLECAVADVVVTADPERLMTSIEHVVRNGQDAAAGSGLLSIRLARDGDRAVIQVADSGSGMSAEFIRDRLFRPFDSTKGSKGMGIGAYQVRDYVRSLHGEVAVSSSPGAGTVFAISLPVTAETQEP